MFISCRHLCLALIFAIGALHAQDAGLAREIALTPHEGSAPEDRAIVHWQERVRDGRHGTQAWESLGWAFVAKARRTQDAGYYKLAEKCAEVLAASGGSSAEARLLRGHVLHNLHHFADAERIARELVAERGAPADLALLSDALVEQGKLAEAIPLLQRLANAKPGPEADSRIAHVRWLKGDVTGAMAAIEAALRAASPREAETRAWLLVRLSGFALQRAEIERALICSEQALAAAPAYAPALLARGRALFAQEKRTEAITALRESVAQNPSVEAQWWLADALRATGADEEARRVETALLRHGASADPRTFVFFLVTRGGRAAEALRFAREELAQRADVLSHDALAWASFASGDLRAAAESMDAARAEGTRDARLAWHAAEIARAGGKSAPAAAAFAEAQAMRHTLTPSEQTALARAAAGMTPIGTP